MNPRARHARSVLRDELMHSIKIIRNYTLPQSREGRGVDRAEILRYDSDDWRTPERWAADELRDAGCTHHNWGPRFVTVEPKITDFSRGEEMTATAELTGFTTEAIRHVITELES